LYPPCHTHGVTYKDLSLLGNILIEITKLYIERFLPNNHCFVFWSFHWIKDVKQFTASSFF